MEFIGEFDRFLLWVILRTLHLSGWKHMSQSCSHLAAASRFSSRFLASLSEWISL